MSKSKKAATVTTEVPTATVPSAPAPTVTETPAPEPKTPKAKTPKTPKPAPTVKLTRYASASLTVLRNGGTVEELVKLADADYANQGGTANAKESAQSVGRAISILEAIGLVKSNGDGVEVIGKVVAK